MQNPSFNKCLTSYIRSGMLIFLSYKCQTIANTNIKKILTKCKDFPIKTIENYEKAF